MYLAIYLAMIFFVYRALEGNIDHAGAKLLWSLCWPIVFVTGVLAGLLSMIQDLWEALGAVLKKSPGLPGPQLVGLYKNNLNNGIYL